MPLIVVDWRTAAPATGVVIATLPGRSWFGINGAGPQISPVRTIPMMAITDTARYMAGSWVSSRARQSCPYHSMMAIIDIAQYIADVIVVNASIAGATTAPLRCDAGVDSRCRHGLLLNFQFYIVAPRIHGLNSSSPMPCASLRLFSPDATAIIFSKISRPTASTLTPSRMRPALISMSLCMRS
jgi:hypothetical protein